MPVKSVLFIVLVKSSCPSFCQLVQSDTEKKKLKKPSHKDDFASFLLLQLIFALCILIPLYAYYTRLYYQVHRNLKLYVPSNFNLDHYREFFFFALESILYVISSALAAFFWKKFLCYIFFHLFTFTLPVSLYF